MGTLFVTVGSTMFPALTDFIIQAESLAKLKDMGITQVTVQHGSYAPQKCEASQAHPKVTTFDYAGSLQAHIRAATLIVSHAGAGSIVEVTDQGKALIVVVNSALMNDHQSELASAMSERHCCRVIRHDRITSDLIAAIRDGLVAPRDDADAPRRARGVFGRIVGDELGAVWPDGNGAM